MEKPSLPSEPRLKRDVSEAKKIKSVSRYNSVVSSDVLTPKKGHDLIYSTWCTVNELYG